MAEDIYSIRFARPDELKAIQQIENAAASLFRNTDYSFVEDDDPASIDLLAAQQKENMLWVAADSSDQPVGFAIARLVDDDAYIHELAVHPSHGRRGLGRRLISAVCQWAKEKGLGAVTLSTFRDIEWNAPFYARLGFRILASEELTPGLIAVREKEARSGLPINERVCMRFELREMNADD